MSKPDQTIQSFFLEAIKQQLSPSQSLVNELSDILEVSTDSAYRRIRGETALSLDEVAKIAKIYRISLDSLMGTGAGAVTFRYNVLTSLDDYRGYLTSMHKDLSMIAQSKDNKIYYASVDMPIFHHFRYNKLSAFKMFYWLKSVIEEPTFSNMKFDFEVIPNDLIELGHQIYDLYCKITSFEIWTENTIISNLKQIEYYWEAGIFESENDALDVCNELREEISNIKRQAEMKSKFLSKDEVIKDYSDNYMLHISDIEVGNNCIQVSVNDMNVVYLSYHTFNKMSTTNKDFCEETNDWMHGLISRSTLISGVAEKQRYKFFRNIFNRIDKLVYRINES